jgi:hypothetical protein
MPTELNVPVVLKNPVTPTTAFICRSASVVAGSSRFIFQEFPQNLKGP